MNQADEFKDISLDSSTDVAWSQNEGVHVQRPNQRSLITPGNHCRGRELGKYDCEVSLGDPMNLH